MHDPDSLLARRARREARYDGLLPRRSTTTNGPMPPPQLRMVVAALARRRRRLTGAETRSDPALARMSRYLNQAVVCARKFGG